MSIRIRREQVATMRREKFAAGLISYFEDANVRARRDPATGDVLVPNAAGQNSRYSFNQDGFIGGFTTPMGRSHAIQSTPDGNVSRITNPAGRNLSLEYLQNGQVSRVLQDSKSLFELQYDEMHRVSRVTYHDRTTTDITYAQGVRVASVTNRLGQTELFEYLHGDRLAALTDGNGNRTTFAYSAWDRPSSAYFPDGSQERYSYDRKGHVAQVRVGTELLVDIAYEHGESPSSFQYGDQRSLHFEYDTAGRPVKAINEDIVVAYEYDQQGRVISEQQGDQVVRYKYDPTGNVVQLTYPAGETVEFAYDADGRISSIKDWNEGTHAFAYNANDRGYSLRVPGGIQIDVTSSTIGLPTSHVARRSSQKLFEQTFKYDLEDRLTELTDSDFGVRALRYDAEGQLIAATGSGAISAESFRYDGAGNRDVINEQSAAFNSLNQLLTEGQNFCRYDLRGNMIGYQTEGGHWRLHYSHQNLLTSAEGPRGQKLLFRYDAFGRRISKRMQHQNTTTESRYIWAGEHLIAEIQIEGGQTRTQEFIYHPGGFVPFATRVDGAVYNYHCNHIGLPHRLTDSLGHVVWSAVHRAFGQTHTVINKVPNPLRFPGHYYDCETGLHYNRFRYYSPQFGRYISRDPLGFVGGANLYSYVGNDPINRSDPAGMWWKAALSVVAGVAAAAAVVLTAPVSLPLLAIGAAAAVVGVGVGVGLDKALNMKEFNLKCFAEAFGWGFLKGALFAGALIAAATLFPAAATVLAVGAAAVGIYSMLQEHFGWHLFPWEKNSKSYFEMSAAEQNRSLGDLAGTFAGAGATGILARSYILPRVAEPTQSDVGKPSRVYRVQGGTPPAASRTRIGIGEQGEMTVDGDDMLFVTFDDVGRASAFKANNRPGAEIISFDVEPSFVQQVKASAVPQAQARAFPDSPQIADPSKTKNSFGLSGSWIEALKKAAIPGTGRRE